MSVVALLLYLLSAASITDVVYAQDAQTKTTSSVEHTFRADSFFLPDEALLGFVSIAPGSFPMGSNPLIDPLAFENERWSEARRQGIVELPQYYIARYETTVAQFAAFVEATGYRVDPQALQASSDYPVSYISWTDAIAYTRWLDKQIKTIVNLAPELREFLDNGGHVSLPNEAEWEKAAKGEDGRIYPWGNQFQANKANVDSGMAREVGSFSCPECAYGLSDLSGNVWEWTRSPYQSYPFSNEVVRANLAEDALWTMRGGAFNDAPNNARAAVRGAADPGARRPFIGFRVVLSKQ